MALVGVTEYVLKGLLLGETSSPPVAGTFFAAITELPISLPSPTNSILDFRILYPALSAI